MTAVRVAFSQVGIEEFDSCLLGKLVADLPNQLVFLMGTNEEGGGKRCKAHFKGGIGRFGESQAEAVPAALFFTSHYLAEVVDEVRPLAYDKRQLYFFCQ